MTGLWRLTCESTSDIRSRPIIAALLVIVTGGVLLATSLTAGRTAAVEAEVMSQIDEAASRTFIVRASSDSSIDVLASRYITELEPTVWTFALSNASDVRVQQTGLSIPMREFTGEIPDSVKIWEGRAPREGEAIFCPSSTGSIIYGEVAGSFIREGGQVLPIVGRCGVDEELDFLEGSILLRSGEPLPVHSIVVQAGTFGDVAALVDAATVISGLPPDEISIEETTSLNSVRSLVEGSLGRFSRSLTLILTAASSVLVGFVTFVQVLARRRDFGRRRALGASQGNIVYMILVQSAYAAVVGCLLGGTSSIAIFRILLTEEPDPLYLLSASYLVVLAALVGSLPAAALAAARDPVRVLRVP